MNVVTKNVALPDGRVITSETGKLAKQADGSVMLRLGNTMLLATVCAAKDLHRTNVASYGISRNYGFCH